MFKISESTDRPQGAHLGDWSIKGNVIPQKFTITPLPGDGRHETVKIIAPNGDEIIHVAWCGQHPCGSNWSQVRAFLDHHLAASVENSK